MLGSVTHDAPIFPKFLDVVHGHSQMDSVIPVTVQRHLHMTTCQLSLVPVIAQKR